MYRQQWERLVSGLVGPVHIGTSHDREHEHE
jgi:hypothetical protein